MERVRFRLKEKIMKLFNRLLALVAAFALAFSLAACNKDDEETNENLVGWAFEYKEEDVAEEDLTEGGKTKYLVIDGLFLADGTAVSVTKEDFEAVTVAMNDSIVVADLNDKDEKQYGNADKDGKQALKTKTLSFADYDHVEIAEDAFTNQKFIGGVEIGSAVTKIGAAAFSGCSNLKSMVLPFVGTSVDAVNGGKVLGSLFGTVEADGCTAVEMSYNASGKTSYYIPSSLETIKVKGAAGYELPRYAFNKISTLKTVEVANAAKIGASAFAGCTALTKFTVTSSVTEIGDYAFSGCSALTRIDFTAASALTKIGQNAFENCTKLGYGKSYQLVIPASVTEIGAFAFYKCTSLKSIDISKLNVVEESCFFGCSVLETVVLKNGATLKVCSFADCEKLDKSSLAAYSPVDEGAFGNK